MISKHNEAFPFLGDLNYVNCGGGRFSIRQTWGQIWLLKPPLLEMLAV